MLALLMPMAMVLGSAGAAKEADRCTITAEKGDRVRKGGDVVIAAGETVGDAVAVDGNVVVKAGAKVKTAMALHGSVTVEAGATVTGSAIAIGGRVHIAKTAVVGESRIALNDGGLDLVSDDGDAVHLSAVLGSQHLAKMILKPMLAKLHGCVVLADETL